MPAKARVLTAEHISILGEVAAKLFPEVDDGDIGFKRQIGINLGSQGTVYLDYVLSVRSSNFVGRKSVILEVQGGGETSNTGTLTEHVGLWAADPNRTNNQLGKAFSNVGLIPDNAWKRQLRQVFRKSPIAEKFGGGFGLVMGTTLFNYVRRTIDVGRDWYPEWEVALLELSEVPSNRPGFVPFRAERAVFMTYAEFVAAVSGGGVPVTVASPFLGTYTSLHNELFTL